MSPTLTSLIVLAYAAFVFGCITICTRAILRTGRR